MTRNQLNAAIASLLRASQQEVDKTGVAADNIWTVHMTASLVTMHLANALMDVRDMEDQPNGKA